ncbi:MAG: non-ribosomal peptide synthetase, partial [bacterium]|nr:non-ribosomal peptide synthetase [bacterium]
YFVPAKGIEDPDSVSVPGLKEYLSTVVPGYIVPPYFIPLDELPLTPSGKIDRNALPEPGLSPGDTEAYVAPRYDVEEKLVELWSDVLTMEQQRIGIDDNFFQLGGHSLKAILMMSKIHHRLGIKIALTEIFKTPTIRGLGATLKSLGILETPYAAIPPVEEKEYYPLSPAQKRLYVLHQMETDSTNYNIPWAVILEGPVDRERLTGTFKQLIHRHESLRTSFEIIDQEPVQIVYGHVDFEVGYSRAKGNLNVKDFIRPFDLTRVPLLRVSLIPLEGQRYILAADMHHIISDGMSMEILIREFATLYMGSDLTPLKVQYKDYSRWQNSRVQSAQAKIQENYWLNRMSGEIPV